MSYCLFIQLQIYMFLQVLSIVHVPQNLILGDKYECFGLQATEWMIISLAVPAASKTLQTEYQIILLTRPYSRRTFYQSANPVPWLGQESCPEPMEPSHEYRRPALSKKRIWWPALKESRGSAVFYCEGVAMRHCDARVTDTLRRNNTYTDQYWTRGQLTVRCGCVV